MTSRWVKYTGVILSILLAKLQPLHASGDQIVIVKSSNNSYFNQTIETLINQNEESVSFKIIDTKSIDSSSALILNSDHIIALGIKASQAVSERFPKKFLINAYLTQEQHNQLLADSTNHLSVLLDQPLRRYLAFSRFLLKPKSVGIINHSPIELNQYQQNTLKRFKLRLNQYQPDNSRNILGTVRQLARQNDVLLMLPDQHIYNRGTLKGILLTTYRAGNPVISYSPGHVKSGALASIYSSPVDIGRHLADILKSHGKDSADTGGNKRFARYYSMSINSRVAHALGIGLLPDEEKLRQLIDEETR